MLPIVSVAVAGACSCYSQQAVFPSQHVHFNAVRPLRSIIKNLKRNQSKTKHYKKKNEKKRE